METGENLNISHLRPPSKIPSSQVLFEASASRENARSGLAMAPPSIIPMKHKNLSRPESPPPKRQTLIARGGITTRSNDSQSNISKPTSLKTLNGPLKGQSLITARNTSYASSSSVSSRNPTVTSRNTSGSSFTTTGGPSHRYGLHRSQTSMGHNKTPAQSSNHRSASSMENHNSDGRKTKRNGMPPISISTNRRSPSRGLNQLNPRKLRGSYDNQMNYVSHWSSSIASQSLQSSRETSLSKAMDHLCITPQNDEPQTPQSMIPVLSPKRTHPLQNAFDTPLKSPQRYPTPIRPFLTRDSNLQAWDLNGRLDDVESGYGTMAKMIKDSIAEASNLKEIIAMHKSRINELEQIKKELTETNTTLRVELDSTKTRLLTADTTLDSLKRTSTIELDDTKREHKFEVDRLLQAHKSELHELQRKYENELDKARQANREELDRLSESHRNELNKIASASALEKQRTELEVESKSRQSQTIQSELNKVNSDLEMERNLNRDLRQKLSESAASNLTLEGSLRAMRAKIEFLESDSQSQSKAFVTLDQQLQDALAAAEEAKEKLRAEETLRRKLHNQVQELKGNIRVFCRVRPPLAIDGEAAKIKFPDTEQDSKEIEIMGPEERSSLGTITKKTNAFSFDRVFGPQSQNENIFDEISQLVQSALDGYNVCIFCYGQTGSGKTFTMSSRDGMIPRATRQIYDTAKSLEEKGWKYSMEGSFVEVYNENLNDLLGKAEEFDRKKHEIRHDMQKKMTTITDITTVDLDSPEKVETILQRASSNRSVAATKANERSSRSHSVFILKLIGENRMTGEKSEGTLNLVDLAGSERLSQSQATGERLKETQNINRSLSCLGDVIGALGQGKEGGHVPYRNSKLTYLLQFSLGGNSKTLMFVMVSPLQAHLSETLTSLKFATKVHNTHIGTARKQTKTKG